MARGPKGNFAYRHDDQHEFELRVLKGNDITVPYETWVSWPDSVNQWRQKIFNSFLAFPWACPARKAPASHRLAWPKDAPHEKLACRRTMHTRILAWFESPLQSGVKEPIPGTRTRSSLPVAKPIFDQLGRAARTTTLTAATTLCILPSDRAKFFHVTGQSLQRSTGIGTLTKIR